MLSIISGKFKGRRLITPKSGPVRPTLSKTRDAIFNIIQSRFNLKDYKVADLFAGTGALGFEALSRGAESVTFIETNHQLYSLLKKNHLQINPQIPCSFFQLDALQWLKKQDFQNRPWLLLLDPPYDSPLLDKTLDLLGRRREDLKDSIIVIETDLDHPLEYKENFKIFKQRRFGSTGLDFIAIQ